MNNSPHPVAAHTYFHIINKAEQRELFLGGAIDNPRFLYRDSCDQSVILDRLTGTVEGTRENLSLKLVHKSLLLNNGPSEDSLEAFRKANLGLFEEPDLSCIDAFLDRSSEMVSELTRAYWGFIEDKIGNSLASSMPSVGPDIEVFEHYKAHFLRYLNIESHDMSAKTTHELIGQLLTKTGLTRSGWKLKFTDDESHASVSHDRKEIVIGRFYKARMKHSPLRIAVHEVLGHALRGKRSSIDESEGFAIVLEQLIDYRFKPRRVYRYLAGAFGWGTKGQRMDFREVYEIIWRLMVIRSGYAVATAQSRAFDECARVFRGGLPSMPGAVYLKDIVYLSANLKIWRLLSEEMLDYEQFVDIIEGRREVLA